LFGYSAERNEQPEAPSIEQCTIPCRYSLNQLVDVRVRFSGDVVPLGSFRVEMPEDLPIIVHFECPITKARLLAQGKVALRAEGDSLAMVFGKHFRVACLANNHMMDKEAEAISDTVALREDTDVKSLWSPRL
jgi:hypothetical protein